MFSYDSQPVMFDKLASRTETNKNKYFPNFYRQCQEMLERKNSSPSRTALPGEAGLQYCGGRTAPAKQDVKSKYLEN